MGTTLGDLTKKMQGLRPNLDSWYAIPQTLNFPKNPLITNMEANLASEFYERISALISQFDKELDNAHEVGIRLVNFGQTVVFHLDWIGYWNPSLMCFGGVSDGGEPVQLVQHVSQISILLMKVARANPDEPKKEIGFLACLDQDTEE